MRKYVNINVHFLSIWVKNIFFEIFITKTPFTLYFFTDFDKNAQEGTRRHIFKWRIRICTLFFFCTVGKKKINFLNYLLCNFGISE